MNERLSAEHENWSQGAKDRERVLKEKRALVESFYTDYQEEGKERVGIDPEMKEAIAVLLAADFHTESCCWGHPERRDDHEALHAEKNLFPYISFTGYQPTDGLDEQGEAVGFTREQTDVACTRMQQDANDLRGLLDEFYGKQAVDGADRLVELRYFDGMPGAELATRGDRVSFDEGTDEVDRDKQDLDIAKARAQWSAFLTFLKDEYISDKL